MTATTDITPHIAILGFGAIGRDLCRKLLAHGCQVSVLLREGAAITDQPPHRVRFVDTIEALLTAKPSVVVEVAGQGALLALCPDFLNGGLDVIAASVGAVGVDGFMQKVDAITQRGGGRLILPTGAVGGIDYLNVVATADDLSVIYISRKPVGAWKAELEALGHDPTALKKEVALFEGDAITAARLYPRNLNAGLTVALAAGMKRTTVRVIADPEVSLNSHEILVRSAFGTASMRFANKPSPDNPKTSAITAASLMVEVKRYLAGQLHPAH